MNRDYIEIVKAAQGGDKRAFEALYNMTKDSAYFIALSITKNEQDALDIMQDSYMKAFMNISRINTPEAFDNWFNRIVANTSKRYIKKKKPMLFADINKNAPTEWNEEELNKDYLPQESVDTKETSRILMELINGLSEDKRLCILMYYYQDMSVKEIAETLELSVSTVKYNLYSARAELKKGAEALEKRDTKLYGLFPFVLFPALFRGAEEGFIRVHTVPLYSCLNLSSVMPQTLSANAVQPQFVSERSNTVQTTQGMQAGRTTAVNTAVKHSFFSTLAGKIAAVTAAAAIVVGGITAMVVIINNGNSNSAANRYPTQKSSVAEQSQNSDSTISGLNIENMDMFSGALELDGIVYTLPCDLSEFEKNGWHMEKSSQERYDSGDPLSPHDTTLYFQLTKNDKKSSIMVRIAFVNPDDTAVPLTNCPVGSVRIDVDGSQSTEGAYVRFPGGFVIDRSVTVNDFKVKYSQPDNDMGYILQYKNQGGHPELIQAFFDNPNATPSQAKMNFEILYYDYYNVQ